MAEFQKGQTDTFIKHIQFASKIARRDPSAVLVFSGGQTSSKAGPISEGQSYWLLAEALGELVIDTDGNSLAGRMIAEEFARDSYENLLFSIARFKEYTGQYPRKITVVGLEFKKQRFINLHRAILHFPIENFSYFGIDPPQLKGNPPTAGEKANAEIPFSEDPHGCTNKILVNKRRERNPFRRTHPYTLSCPELYNIFTICNRDNVPESIYYALPWSYAATVSSSASSTLSKAGETAVTEATEKENQNGKRIATIDQSLLSTATEQSTISANSGLPTSTQTPELTITSSSPGSTSSLHVWFIGPLVNEKLMFYPIQLLVFPSHSVIVRRPTFLALCRKSELSFAPAVF